MDHAQRLALAREIADRILAARGEDVLAVGIYGSTARGTDGPYSDVEMLCVLRTSGEDYDYEWSCGPWKAEVNFRSQDVEFGRAGLVDGDWALTHGLYGDVLPLHDPGHLFEQLRARVDGATDEQFAQAIRGVVVGEIYEFVGKLRNAMRQGALDSIPRIAMEMVWQSALALGLARRHTYQTGARLLFDSLSLPGRMAGYDRLCGMVMSGRLSERDEVAAACEALWAGVQEWAGQMGIVMEDSRRIPF